MSRVWKLALPLAALVAVLGYAAASLASSDFDDQNQRETIVIDDAPEKKQASDDRPGRPGKKGGDDRGDDGGTGDADDVDDVDDVEPDVDDLDDDDDANGDDDDR
jgi:hypothetical protein